MIDVEALAREIAFRLDPEALLDAEDVDTMLKVTPRYITDDAERTARLLPATLVAL